MNKNQKGRHWAFIVYPESAPDNWRSMIQSLGCPFAVSPLHDQDYNEIAEDDGSIIKEMKKPHYHCVISYSNTTTFNNVKTSLCDMINAPIPQLISSVKGAIRYFTHMDNPEKAQYDISDIYVCNGFDLDDYKKLSYSQIQDIKFSLVHYVLDKGITNYMDLIFDVASLNLDWRNVVMDNTIFFKEIIRSNKKRLRSDAECGNSYREIKSKFFDD